VSEPVDRGATYSTFGMIRASRAADGARALGSSLPSAVGDPLATQNFVLRSKDYAWSSQVDATGLQQMLALWAQPEPPGVTWWNTTLTDTGHHEGGPWSDVARASLRDSDARLGAWLALVEERGLLDDVTILLTADHGMAAADPACTGDWDEALVAAGVRFRDEAFGWIYFGV
jgi:phosphonoacetate hydrolase